MAQDAVVGERAPHAAFADDRKRASLLSTVTQAADEAAALVDEAARRLKADLGAVAPADRRAMLAERQAVTHALSWFATTAAALAQAAATARRLDEAGRFGECEALLLAVGAEEYAAQLLAGVPMSQTEYARPHDLGIAGTVSSLIAQEAALARLAHDPDRHRHRQLLAAALAKGARGTDLVDLDETLALVRETFARFADAHQEDAHRWHLDDALIPLEVIAELAEMGVFGLTIAEEFGGAGLGKAAMCVVSEELSRGYIGLGSLGTRSEIAAELIMTGGT
ncbi:MAG: acyl-CoA dehydrogenase family protein, partial [Alphaproteobacteria bacterium]